MLESGANPNAPLTDGWIALHIAAQNGNVALSRLLIERGSAPMINLREDHGVTPIWVAGSFDHFALVEYLLEAGAKADVANEDGATPLIMAAQEGQAQSVRLLVEKGGADVDFEDNNGQTGLAPARAGASRRAFENADAFLRFPSKCRRTSRVPRAGPRGQVRPHRHGPVPRRERRGLH